MPKQNPNLITNALTHTLDKLKKGQDEGPGGTVTLTNEEATLAYRALTEVFGVKHPGVS